jgi:hypothetical protein
LAPSATERREPGTAGFCAAGAAAELGLACADPPFASGAGGWAERTFAVEGGRADAGEG